MLYQRPRLPVVLDQSPVRFNPKEPAAASLPTYPRFDWDAPAPKAQA